MDPIALIFYLLSAAVWTIPKPTWPDESSLGVNAGISPGKSGFGLFYGHGLNQWNLGILYSIGSEVAGHTNVRAGMTYNRQLTRWGFYAAAGMNLTYSIETSEEYGREENPWEPNTPPIEGVAWRSRGISEPEFLLTLGEAFWFGETRRFGLNADAGFALPFGYGVSHSPYPVLGAGISYRFRVN